MYVYIVVYYGPTAVRLGHFQGSLFKVLLSSDCRRKTIGGFAARQAGLWVSWPLLTASLSSFIEKSWTT